MNKFKKQKEIFWIKSIYFLGREARDEYVALLVSFTEADQFLAYLAHFFAIDRCLVTQLFDQFSLRS